MHGWQDNFRRMLLRGARSVQQYEGFDGSHTIAPSSAAALKEELATRALAAPQDADVDVAQGALHRRGYRWACVVTTPVLPGREELQSLASRLSQRIAGGSRRLWALCRKHDRPNNGYDAGSMWWTRQGTALTLVCAERFECRICTQH